MGLNQSVNTFTYLPMQKQAPLTGSELGIHIVVAPKDAAGVGHGPQGREVADRGVQPGGYASHHMVTVTQLAAFLFQQVVIFVQLEQHEKDNTVQ